MDLRTASEGLRYREPLLPDIGLPDPHAVGPDGELHAYAPGANTTLCRWPLGLLHLWPATPWPVGAVAAEVCLECSLAAFPGG